MRFARKFISGFLSPLVGVSLIINHSALRRLSLLPFIATAVIFIFGLAFGLPFITSLVTPFAHWLTSLFGIRNEALNFGLPFFLWPALALMLVYLLLTLTRLVASPLYGLLAERVLMKQGVIEDRRVNLMHWTRKQFRVTRSAVIKAVLFLVLGIILGVLSFIPGLGLFTGFAFLVLLAYDVVDYALEALAWSYERRVAFFRQHFAVFLGLGTMLGLVFLIPGLNFFALPAAVAGASDLVRRTLGLSQKDDT